MLDVVNCSDRWRCFRGASRPATRGVIWRGTSLEIRVQPWVVPASGPDMDTRVTCRVESRVEFVLDGRTESLMSASQGYGSSPAGVLALLYQRDVNFNDELRHAPILIDHPLPTR
ncbi:hypothetical protein NCCP1664_23870 [Zafaria cholistanensis]|uniref:Uncharacterized protein n=1 Tax=Zafaria cholistanensis TaxID=1682741 RepID=A0A5A7NUN2_9MICC|nr:hypothetical protein NCCP1664_23870 [Zafaria cholistanensis]